MDDTELTLDLIVYDTAAILNFKYNPEEQEAWFNETLQNSNGTWKIVFGHHPHYSAGRYPAYPRLHRYGKNEISVLVSSTSFDLK